MSDYDPIHSLQPSPAEIRAVVQAASDWGTYVLAHAYTSEAIRRLVDNGVKCIEHGLLIDDATAKYVKQNGVVISTQLVVYRALKDLPGITETNIRKLDIVLEGQENLIRLIKKYDITTGFATDLIGGMYPMLTREFTERAMYVLDAGRSAQTGDLGKREGHPHGRPAQSSRQLRRDSRRLGGGPAADQRRAARGHLGTQESGRESCPDNERRGDRQEPALSLGRCIDKKGVRAYSTFP